MLFDLDGTLADTAPDLAAAANAMRIARGLPPMPFDALRRVASHGARGLLRVAFERAPDDADYEALRVEFLARYEAALAVHSRLFDGMAEVLDALDARGIAWGIVTNKAMRFTDPLTERLGLVGRAGGDRVGRHDAVPEAASCAVAARRRTPGLPPAACVYVGDDHARHRGRTSRRHGHHRRGLGLLRRDRADAMAGGRGARASARPARPARPLDALRQRKIRKFGRVLLILRGAAP